MAKAARSIKDLPDFQLDESQIPDLRVKSIRFQNYKVFEDFTLDLTSEDGCKKFACFFGPNGCGKTTILEGIQLIFSRFEGRTPENIRAFLGKSVRHVNGKQDGGIYRDNDFLISACLSCSLGDYEVQINKTGFIKDHPVEVKNILYRLCFYARFDQELHQFQLARNKWNTFKDLFESVTGFEIEESVDIFSNSADPDQAKMMRKFVLGFSVQKPDEIISHKECSAGERKIIKSFSTLLSKEYNPRVILVDNVAMHVESGRHLNLINSLKRCFPNSQIFATTHSYQISRNFGERSELYDLRLLKVSDLLKAEPFRLYWVDEIQDAISKLKSFTMRDMSGQIQTGESLIKRCLTASLGDQRMLPAEVGVFLKEVAQLFVEDALYYHSKRNTT